jgi:hypothetical protein
MEDELELKPAYDESDFRWGFKYVDTSSSLSMASTGFLGTLAGFRTSVILGYKYSY